MAGVFALFFFDGVPRVQKVSWYRHCTQGDGLANGQQDILQKIPFIGGFFVHEVPPEDNPF